MAEKINTKGAVYTAWKDGVPVFKGMAREIKAHFRINKNVFIDDIVRDGWEGYTFTTELSDMYMNGYHVEDRDRFKREWDEACERLFPYCRMDIDLFRYEWICACMEVRKGLGYDI